LLVSPLIMWIWIGGLIVFGGGLLALSPSLGALRRRAAAGARARRAAWPAPVGSAVAGSPASPAPAELVALERAREVKYRELHDLEFDYATGKLSREDYEATSAALRMEALEILDQLEPLPGLLQEQDRVSDEQDREEDSPAVEVALHK
jgi:hypothetical protein